MSQQSLIAPAGADEALRAEVARFNALQDELGLARAIRENDRLATAVAELPLELGSLRDGGYRFGPDLELAVASLQATWSELRRQLEAQVRSQTETLAWRASDVRQRLAAGQIADESLDALEGQARSAATTLESRQRAFARELDALTARVDDVAWMLAQGAQACFSLESGESFVEAVPANWKKQGDPDGVEGVLFLTDRRLIFEQREEVVTRRLLFIPTRKEKRQALQWAIPLGQLEGVSGSRRGLLGKDDYLTIGHQGGTPFSTTDIHLRGETGEDWQGHIARAQRGEIPTESGLWGTVAPIWLRTRTGTLAVKLHGSWEARRIDGLALPDATGQVQTILTSVSTDVLGALRVEGLPDLQRQRPSIEASLHEQARDRVHALGLDLLVVHVAGLQEAPAH
jgi:hypothetical protein